MKKRYKAIIWGVLILFTAAIGYILLPQKTKQTPVYLLLEQGSKLTNSMVTDQLATIRTGLVSVAEKVGTNNEFCTNIQEYFTTLSNRVDAILEIDSTNKIRCSSNQKFIGTDAFFLDSFKIFLDDPDHNPTVSRIFAAPDGQKAIAAYVPIFDSQKIYVGSVASITYLKNIGTKISAPNSLAQAGYVVLFDDNGDILYHFDKTLVGKNYWSEEIQTYTHQNKELNDVFSETAKGIVTSRKVPYSVRNENRIGEFRPIPVGKNHYVIVLTSIPNY